MSSEFDQGILPSKNKMKEQLKKIPDINLRPLHTCTHVHQCKHVYTTTCTHEECTYGCDALLQSIASK